MPRSHTLGALLGATTIAAICGATNANVLDPGFVYQAHNHPDGNAAEPYYGLRLDELYGATGDHDIFTFDFDYDDMSGTEAAVFVSIFEYPNHPGEFRITISGDAWGGRDTNGSYAADGYLGWYQFEFVYNVGAELATPDDDYIVDATPDVKGLNSGWIQGPSGDVFNLTDEPGGNPYTFRLGDEDDDNGHRGYDGVSGWGWLNHSDEPHVKSSDWLFTVESEPTPTPGTLALFGAGVLLSTRRRR